MNSNNITKTNSINLSSEDTLNDKFNFLCFLATPKILKIKKSPKEIIPFIFILVPSELSQTNMIEHYLFQWNDLNTMEEVT